jgi:hypothetical protein
MVWDFCYEGKCGLVALLEISGDFGNAVPITHTVAVRWSFEHDRLCTDSHFLRESADLEIGFDAPSKLARLPIIKQVDEESKISL